MSGEPFELAGGLVRGARMARLRQVPTTLRLSFLLTVMVEALAACAPTVAGTSSSTPLVAGASAVTVQQGSTYYLRFDYTLEQFALTPRDLQVALWVPSGYASDAGDVSSMFALHEVRLAEGWTAELLQVKVQRSKVTTSVSSDQSRVDYSMWAVVKVVVPDGIVPGPYRLRGTLQERSGKTVPVAATLQVLSK